MLSLLLSRRHSVTLLLDASSGLDGTRISERPFLVLPRCCCHLLNIRRCSSALMKWRTVFVLVRSRFLS
jgi:hypothetical protein